MKTITKNVYQFSELSEQAKQKALSELCELCDINTQFEWWEFSCEDAEKVGLKITSFDTYHKKIEGSLTLSMEESINSILKEHGKACDTHKLALEYSEKIQSLNNDIEDEYNLNEKMQDLEKDFKYSLLEEYLSMLEKEYDYETSEEQIISTIEANDYHFTEDGKLA